MAITVGIDQSFTKTGICILCTEAQTSLCREIPSDTSNGHHGKRCLQIANEIKEILNDEAMGGATRYNVFIEAPSGSFRGQASDLPALYWHIVNAIEEYSHSWPIYPVSPNELYKFLTGKGRTAAVNKVVAVQKQYGHLIPPEFVVDYDTKGGIEAHADVYDAIGLAALGECYLYPDRFTKAQRDAIAKIKQLD